ADFGPPTTARSCARAPTFLIWNVTTPALSVGARLILNSFSVTWTTCGVGAGLPGGAFGTVVVGWVVGAGVDVDCSVEALSLCSFGSAPNTSTAVSIPKKKTNVTMMNARRPWPGNCGRNRGNRNDEQSAKTM